MINEIQGHPRKYGRYIDLSDVFSDVRDSMFYTLVHLRDVGYSLIAENIYKNLQCGPEPLYILHML